MIETTLLHHFIGVARAGSFTRASLHLHTSQSVLSRSVKRLEEQVGTALLERTSRKVVLTPAGQAFLAEASFIIERLKVATNDARRIGHGFSDKLRVGLCPSFSWSALKITHAIRAFQAQWPNVHVDISAVPSADQPQALSAADIDIGFISFAEVDRAGLEYEIVASVVPCVAAPSSWDLPKTGVTLLDLSERPWMIPHPKLAPAAYGRFTTLCRSAGFEPQITAFTEDGFSGAIQVACGCGAVFVEVPVSDSLEGVDYIPLHNLPTALTVDYAIAWLATTPNDHIANFLQCAQQLKT